MIHEETGKRIINSSGYHQRSAGIERIGDPNPDWTSALTNSFSYKGLTFSFEWQYRHGGDVYSTTAAAVIGRGISADTEFDRDQAWILDGVKADGSPNDFVLTTTNAYWWTYFSDGIDAARIYDGTTIRLNEVSLSYSLPSSLLEKRRSEM